MAKPKTYPFTRADGKVVRVTIPDRDEDPSPMPAATFTAAQAKYLDHAVAVGATLGAMADQLRRVGACVNANPRSWGYAGSMASIREALEELLQHLEEIK